MAWADALETARRYVDAPGIGFEIFDAEKATCLSGLHLGIDPADFAEYIETFSDNVHPRSAALNGLGYGASFHDLEILSEAEISAHPFYDWLRRVGDYRYAVVHSAYRSDTIHASIHPQFEARHADRLGACKTQLARISDAVRTGVELRRLKLTGAADWLGDTQPHALWLLDHRFHVLHANRRAEAVEPAANA